jgi:hypothetical protein
MEVKGKLRAPAALVLRKDLSVDTPNSMLDRSGSRYYELETRQAMYVAYYVTMRRLRATTVAVEKQ